MKKILLLLFLCTEAISYGCGLCVGDTGRRLRKHTLEVLNTVSDEKTCNCNCSQQPRSKHPDRPKCLKCQHFLLPHDPISKKVIIKPDEAEEFNPWTQNTWIRFEEKLKDEFEEIN